LKKCSTAQFKNKAYLVSKVGGERCDVFSQFCRVYLKVGTHCTLFELTELLTDLLTSVLDQESLAQRRFLGEEGNIKYLLKITNTY
jgi:hypothetical protein